MIGFAGTSFGFASESDSIDYFSNPNYKIFSVVEGIHEYRVPYKISGAELNIMDLDCDGTEFIIGLEGAKDGTLIINIPRKMLDTRFNNSDDNFFVLLDGKEIDFKENYSDNESRTLEIPFFKGSQVLEIIVTQLISQFPENEVFCGEGAEESPYYNLLSPSKQQDLGITVESIQCKSKLVLILKYDGTPACVKPETKQKLIERRWTQDIYNKDQNPSLSENSVELYKKKYDAVIEGKVLWSIGHKSYPVRLQYDIEPIKIHKIHPALRNENTISFVGERDTATEIGKIAVFGLDYDEKDNYFRLVDRFILDSSNTESEPSTVIEISFGKPMERKFLPVVFSEITTNAESLDKITVWKFELIGHSGDDRRITWDTVPRDTGIFYEITDENGQDIIDHTRMPENLEIPADQHVYNMNCGLLQIVEGESAHPTGFPIKNNASTINAKNSWMGIYPNSDGKYSFEFASIFETLVKLPEGAEIVSQESKHCKLTYNIEEDSEGKYTSGYYTKMVFRLE